jgi:hypothetical protein
MDKPENLPAIFSGFLPHGGLAALNPDGIDNPLGDIGDNAENLFLRHKVETFGQLVGLAFMLKMVGDDHLTVRVWAEGWKRGLVNKEKLVSLYLSQDKYVRIGRRPIMTLREMWEIPQYAKHRTTNDVVHPLTAGFTQDEVIALANRVLYINPSDVAMMIGGWFYQSNKALPFGKEFLLTYYKYKDYEGYRPDGKYGALFAIALYHTYPECVDLEDVLEEATNLARSDPESHGIFRYLGLAFTIAGSDKKKWRMAYEGFLEIITSIIFNTHWAFRAEFVIGIFTGDQSIPDKEKSEGLVKIDEALRSKARSYLELARAVRKKRRDIQCG